MNWEWQDYAAEEREIRLWRQQHRRLIGIYWTVVTLICAGIWVALLRWI